MSTDGPEMHDLINRVERLEWQNRWLTRAGVAAVAPVSAVLLMGLAAPTPQTIRPKRFILEDAHGRTAAELALFHSRAGLQLFDVARHTVAALRVYGKHASLDLGGGKVLGEMRPNRGLFPKRHGRA